MTKTMTTTMTMQAGLEPAQLFNGYIGAQVAYALQQIGLFAHLPSNTAVSMNVLAQETGTNLSRLKAMLHAAELLGYFERTDEEFVRLTPLGEQLREWVGCFTWAVGGYGQILQNLSTLAVENVSWPQMRNDKMVALGADLCNRNLMSHLLYEVIDELDFRTIADLGCGNAGRLIDLCRRNSEIKGLGIDISPRAVEMAQENIERQGCADRLQVICANVLDVIDNDAYRDMLSEVEVVSSFMMLHDLYNISDVWENLFDRLRASFPNLKYLIIADTVRMDAEEDPMPIFSVGFELVHSFMEVKLPTRAEYDAAFEKAGLVIEKCIDFGTPNTYLYVLKV